MAHIMRRLMVILLLAGVVGGGLYLFSLTPAAQSLAPERGDRPPAGEVVERDRETFTEGEEIRTERHDHDHHEEASFIEALPGMAGDGVLIALVVAAVVFIPRGIKAVVQPFVEIHRYKPDMESKK